MDAASPMTLDEAAEICLRGKVKAATLRAAASRGELETEKLGRRIVTTPAAIQKWRELCREKQKARVFGSGQQGASNPLSGSSETQDQFTVALAAAKARVVTPSECSRNISAANTTPQPGGVTYIKSLWPT
jgi:hypothetical protein